MKLFSLFQLIFRIANAVLELFTSETTRCSEYRKNFLMPRMFSHVNDETIIKTLWPISECLEMKFLFRIRGLLKVPNKLLIRMLIGSWFGLRVQTGLLYVLINARLPIDLWDMVGMTACKQCWLTEVCDRSKLVCVCRTWTFCIRSPSYAMP